jgi:amidase/6-aminohexanoate-cyclic-dimer hydrolase
VAEASPVVDAAALGAATLVIIGANLRAALEARAAALGRALEPGDVERITWIRAMDGHTARAADYARAIGVMHRTGRVVAPFLERFDALLTPTMCRPPHPLGVIDMMTTDTAAYGQAVLGTIAFTSLWNACGNPAMSVPLGWSREELPLGVQFVARFGDEATLFRLGAQLEAAQPWAARRPPLAPASTRGGA